jgi:hypothetical protein
MYFTDSIPGHTQVGAEVGRTMQVYSIKVAEREGFTLEWPLKVYGVVAARDSVDYRRNLLFFRTRDDCQILTKQVCMGIFLLFFLLFASLLAS